MMSEKEIESGPNEEKVPELKLLPFNLEFLQGKALEASVMLSMLEHEIGKIRINVDSGADIDMEMVNRMFLYRLKQVDEVLDEMIANQY